MGARMQCNLMFGKFGEYEFVSRFGLSRLPSVQLSDVLSYPSEKSNAGACVLATNSRVEYEASQQ